ncbi:MAG: hypothetical protein ACFFKA_16800, partial [Candidatus Thorarchaeota archaeon]
GMFNIEKTGDDVYSYEKRESFDKCKETFHEMVGEMYNGSPIDKMLFKFFEEENYCYRLSKRIWVFSNVPRDIETKIDEYDREILDSDTHSTAYKIFGTSEFTFNRLVANLAKEFGAPENGGGFFGVNSALWRIGRIPELNILFINYMPSEEGGVIRFKIGGGKGANLFKKVDELAFQVFTAYAPEFEKLKVIEEYS